MKLASVVTPPYIYHGWSTRKTFWEDKFTPVNMISCENFNVRKYKEIKNSDQYIALDIYLKLDCLYKKQSTYSLSSYYMVRSVNGLTASMTLSTRRRSNKTKM